MKTAFRAFFKTGDIECLRLYQDNINSDTIPPSVENDDYMHFKGVVSNLFLYTAGWRSQLAHIHVGQDAVDAVNKYMFICNMYIDMKALFGEDPHRMEHYPIKKILFVEKMGE